MLFDYFVKCEAHQFPPSWGPNNFHAEGSVRLLNFSRLAVLQLILVVSLPLAVMQTQVIADSVEIYQRDVLPILQSHCLQCHGADVSKADLRIDTVEPVFQGASGERWHDILNRVEVGDMPPEDAEPLSTDARRKLSAWIRAGFKNALQQDGEQNTPIVRRLNRIEYNNTLKELTGIRLDYARDLPPDTPSRNGFKNNGSALGISPLQIEYYLLAARRAMSKAIVSGSEPRVFHHKFTTSSESNAPKIKTPIGNRMEAGGRFFGKMLEYPKEGEFIVRIKASAMIPPGQGYPRMRISIGLRSDTVAPSKILGEIDVTNAEGNPEIFEFRGRMEEFPLPGHNPKFPGVTIAVTNVHDDGLPAELPLKFETHKFSREQATQVANRTKENAPVLIGVDLEMPSDKVLRDFRKSAKTLQKMIEELRLISADTELDTDLSCRIYDIENEKKRLFGHVRQFAKETGSKFSEMELKFKTLNSGWIEDQQTVLSVFKNVKPVNRRDKKALRALLPKGPERTTLVLDSLEFEGPIFDQWPPKSHRDLLPPFDGDERERAEHSLQRFMTRAFRRPAKSSDVESVMAFYDEIRETSGSFEETMREVFTMVLVSPEFLYLFEPGDGAGPRKLDSHELAARMSYFLWSTMPDASLTAVAGSGGLASSNEIESQVRRMLASPKIGALIENFTDQWLDLDGIERVAINPEYYPKFDNELKVSMKGEARALFREVLLNDLSAKNLIQSDFVMVNASLANHYGLQGPKGGQFEKVQLSNDSPRGGLLTQAGILLLNSTGEDSHPIRRGVWLRTRLLDDPPNSPPADVPEIDADNAEFAKLSVRQQLEHHRTREACNDCHRGIDPWGIPFENFDAVGSLRTEAKRKTTKKNGIINIPVTTDSVLPNGELIKDVKELKDYLSDQEDRRFARALVSRLLEYGLGRDLGFSDRATIEKLTDDFVQADYRLDSLIVSIIQCDKFRTK